MLYKGKGSESFPAVLGAVQVSTGLCVPALQGLQVEVIVTYQTYIEEEGKAPFLFITGGEAFNLKDQEAL